jgi:hypothetical protein
VQKGVAEAAEVSETTFRRILKSRQEHDEQDTYFATPGNKYNVSERINEVNKFDEYRVIHKSVKHFENLQ